MPSKINTVIIRLESVYGRQTRYSRKNAMDQVIATILSQRTNYQDEKTAYDRLLAEFGDWEGVGDASVEAIEAAIATVRFPEIKAPRIKQVINRIIAEHGRANLDFLIDWPVEDARDYLYSFPGIGPKTAAFMLLFTLKKPILPVDTHVHRVSTRTGIIGPKVSQAKAHQLLLAMLPPEPDELLNFHKLLFKHGQRICTWSYPKCYYCVLRDICDYYQLQARPHPPTVENEEKI